VPKAIDQPLDAQRMRWATRAGVKAGDVSALSPQELPYLKTDDSRGADGNATNHPQTSDAAPGLGRAADRGTPRSPAGR